MYEDVTQLYFFWFNTLNHTRASVH